MTGQTENKHITKPPYYTHVQQNKQVLIVAADAVLIQTLTIIPSLIFRKISEAFWYTRSRHVFNSSPETRLTYIHELVNSCEFPKTWHSKQLYRHRLSVKQMESWTQNRKNLKSKHCCQCWPPTYWVSILSSRCGGCHPKGLIFAT